jgi:hypothetical protein
MSELGARWRIDGLDAAYITRGGVNGHYCVTFQQEKAGLEQLQQINWAAPEVQRLTEQTSALGLPEGYGFSVTDIRYDYGSGSFTVEVQTLQPYAEELTACQAEISQLNAQTQAQQETIQALQAEIDSLTTQLAEADELAIALYEAQLTKTDEEGGGAE